MKLAIRIGLCVVAAAIATTMTGCASYYEVRDPASGRVYYATDLREERGGAVKFTDGRDGKVVTLQSSEVKKIEKNEYEHGCAPSGTPK